MIEFFYILGVLIGSVLLGFAYIFGWVLPVSLYFSERAYHEANDWWLFLAFAWMIFWLCTPAALVLTIAQA